MSILVSLYLIIPVTHILWFINTKEYYLANIDEKQNSDVLLEN